MSIIQQIIDAILQMFGMGPKKEPAQLSKADKEKIAKSAVQGLDEVEGAENVHVHGTGEDAKVLEQRDGASLVEEDGEVQWVDRVDTDVPRERWKDEWGPLRGNEGSTTLEEFCLHEMVFDHTRSTDPRGAEKKLQQLGYRDAGHWFKVRATVVKHFAQKTGPNVGDGVFGDQAYIDAGLRAAARKRDLDQAAVVAANPELLSPVEGVTVDMYAQLAARLAQGADQATFLGLLAQHGLDLATWERASGVWNDRMSKDTTATITTKYGQAFMSSGQGQFGAAAQQVAGATATGTAAGGGEPIPFDRNCEIAGAMQAWSETGQDVNAMLAEVFKMNAAEYSAASTWWFTQLTADFKRFDVYNKKVEEYKQRYLAGTKSAGGDIAF